MTTARPIEPNIHRASRPDAVGWKLLSGMIFAEPSMKPGEGRVGSFSDRQTSRKAVSKKNTGEAQLGVPGETVRCEWTRPAAVTGAAFASRAVSRVSDF
ncbi:MAG: hypothetical protein DMG82_06960 [Acidobacteria bacterium]|nr:MAG: hypothetical protein DMG82_06960 [Acidobacteriota bacterium]